MTDAREDRRNSYRIRVDIPVERFRVTGDPHGEAYPGRMESCSRDGFCVEMSREFAVGTVLVARAIRQSDECADHPEVPCLAIAQVRWSQPRSGPAGTRYRIGFKYLML